MNDWSLSFSNHALYPSGIIKTKEDADKFLLAISLLRQFLPDETKPDNYYWGA